MNEKSEKSPKKISSTTRKPSALTMQEMKDLVLFMKEQGVIQFTAGELAVEFNPYAITEVAAAEETPEQVRARLFKEIKDVNKEAEDLENWSV